MSWGGVLLSFLMALILVSAPGRGAQASTTNITWDGGDKSNDHSNDFPGYGGSKFGRGDEDCCGDQSTQYSLKLNDSWNKDFDWSYQHDDTPHLYGDKLPIIPFILGGIY